MRTNWYNAVTTQVTPLLAHDCVAVVLESSRISIYAAVLHSSRLVLGQNRSALSSYQCGSLPLCQPFNGKDYWQ